ncbi:hypothetical protein BCh11DRAFT_06278 [Burkholderia sp. Ch1-1]|nr:hypothetical protein BCh11DRAFT_06278 [Burkholderia sp. Ch1-1]
MQVSSHSMELDSQTPCVSIFRSCPTLQGKTIAPGVSGLPHAGQALHADKRVIGTLRRRFEPEDAP